VWETGTPLSEYGGTGPPFFVPLKFLDQRGTNGRCPALWDLNFRIAYDLDHVLSLPTKLRLILDLFHVGSPQTVVNYDQVHFFDADASGNQSNPNPGYMQPIQFQPPMSARLGLEVNF
jgi:hypothetical protein